MAAIFAAIILTGCGAKDVTKSELENHLSKSGFNGKANHDVGYGLINADDGFKYNGGGIEIEAYKFSSPKKIPTMCNYSNGNWGIKIHDSNSNEMRKKIIASLDELFGQTGKVE